MKYRTMHISLIVTFVAMSQIVNACNSNNPKGGILFGGNYSTLKNTDCAEEDQRIIPSLMQSFNNTEEPFWQILLREGPKYLSFVHIVVAGILIVIGLEIMDYFEKYGGKFVNLNYIPVRGKHLDDFTRFDHFCINFNRVQAIASCYVYLRYFYTEKELIWGFDTMTLLNTFLPVVVCYYVYDFFFFVEHLIVHVRGIYELIHKHHHRQQAPSRGNLDAMNAHPIEFFLHRYTHVLTIFIVSRLMNTHILAAVAYQLSAGTISSINHTRLDLSLEVCGYILYESKMHDVHHRFPRTNYGFYTTFWDRLFGTYRGYHECKVPLNPLDQLDPSTGKSYRHGFSQNNAKKQESKEVKSQ